MKEEPICIGKQNNQMGKRIETVMNIMKYYPLIELGIAIESIKYDIEEARREREKEYYAKNNGNVRSRNSRYKEWLEWKKK